MQELIEQWKQKIQKEELHYRLTGEYEKLGKLKSEAGQEIRRKMQEEKWTPQIKPSRYNDELKYVGDEAILNHIFEEEVQFRKVRKQLDQSTYQERLQKLVRMRNDFAETSGFQNYLDYRYALWGVDREFLASKMQTVAEELGDADYIGELRNGLKELGSKGCFSVAGQMEQLRKTLQLFGADLPWERVIFHTENLPAFYMGACVPVSIPEEIHVLVNPVAGLSGFSMLMHETGHAFYYSNTKPYNLILEEGVALFFENLVYTEAFLKSQIGFDKDLFLCKANAFLPFQICCNEFEQVIYENPQADYAEVWQEMKNRYLKNGRENFTDPHFFVSEPGYFAAYFLGGCLARDMYLHMQNEPQDKIGELLLQKVCSQEGQINLSCF